MQKHLIHEPERAKHLGSEPKLVSTCPHLVRFIEVCSVHCQSRKVCFTHLFRRLANTGLPCGRRFQSEAALHILWATGSSCSLYGSGSPSLCNSQFFQLCLFYVDKGRRALTSGSHHHHTIQHAPCVCVCTYSDTNICIHVNVLICLNLCTLTRAHTYRNTVRATHAHMYLFNSYIHSYIHSFIHSSIQSLLHPFIPSYMYIMLYTYMFIHMYLYIHTFTRRISLYTHVYIYNMHIQISCIYILHVLSISGILYSRHPETRPSNPGGSAWKMPAGRWSSLTETSRCSPPMSRHTVYCYAIYIYIYIHIFLYIDITYCIISEHSICTL